MKRFILKLTIALSATIVVWSCGSEPAVEETTEEMPVEEEAVEVTDAYIDATEVSPDNYKILSEEGNVRVIEMILKPGEKDNFHSHKYESVYFLSGGKAKIVVGDEVMEAEIPDGGVMHHEPWSHMVENVGETTIHAILFEQMERDPGVEYENYIDAIQASPEYYKLLSEEGNVRVIAMTLPPGTGDELHSHKVECVYFISGGKVNIHVGTEVMEAEIPDGHVMHHGAWTHQVENVGETTIEAILFERI